MVASIAVFLMVLVLMNAITFLSAYFVVNDHGKNRDL